MLDFSSVIGLQGTLFLMMLLGILAAKAKLISAESRKGLSNILIYLISPCNIVESFRQQVTMRLLEQSMLVLVISFGLQVFYLFINRFLYRRFPERQQPVLKYATICSNGNFIGIPVIGEIFGTQGVLFAALTLLPVRINIWTSGIALFSQKREKREMARKILLHPCILALFFGFFMMLLQIYPPEPVWKVIESVGDCITPMAMVLVGSIIAEVDWKKLIDKTTVYYSILRLLLIPIVVWIVLRLLGIDSFITDVSVVLAGMPAASLTAVLAEKYDGDVELASRCIVVSTLLSVITVPLLCMLLNGCV